MQISYYGLHGVIQFSKEEFLIFDQLRKYFSVKGDERDLYKVRAFREGYWDGREYMIDKQGKFLRGLTNLIVKKIHELGGEVEGTPYNQMWIEVNKPYVHLADELDLNGIELAEHQRRMTRELLRNGGGTVEGVTGCGKTESITLLARILSEYTDTIFFLVHRIGLMRGAMERVTKRCAELAPYCGLLGDTERPKEGDRIIFSTMQSLASVMGLGKRRKKDKAMQALYESAGAIIIDEAHRVTGEIYQKILAKAPEVPIYQFTGTPEVDDPIKDWTIVGVGGPIVTRVTRPEMEAIGFIAEAIACVREFNRRADDPEPGKKRGRRIDWMPKKDTLSYFVSAYAVNPDEGSLESTQVKVDHEKGLQPKDDEYYLYPDYGRDILLIDGQRNADLVAFVRACLDQKRNPLILCERVAQTYYLRGVLSRQNVLPKEKIGLVHGDHSTAERKEIVSGYESGETPILIASTIFDEGEDIQNVGSVVLASGGASLVKIVQRIGRGVRAKDSEMGNYIPIWFPLDALTEFSREHTITRVTYLERSAITIEECTTDWPTFLNFLRQKYGKNRTRVV